LGRTFIHALLELTDAATEAFHQLRQPSPEEQEADEQDDQPMGAAANIEQSQHQVWLCGHEVSQQSEAG
jgi:hypothetical protein